MHFVIYDTEYTCWEGCNKGGWFTPQHKEIIQIAAIKIDENYNELGRFNVLIKPFFNPKLSNYCVTLTQITQEKMEAEGLEYPKALIAFKEFINEAKCYSYGRDDIIMKENCQLLNIQWPFTQEMYDIRPFYKEAGIETEKYCSGELYQSVNLDLRGHTHNALFDVISLIETAKHLSNRGVLKIT